MTTEEALKRQVYAQLSGILVTAAETEPAPFPESMAYMALGSNMAHWERVRAILTHNKWITITGHAIKLTDAGRDMAKKLQATFAGSEKVQP